MALAGLINLDRLFFVFPENGLIDLLFLHCKYNTEPSFLMLRKVKDGRNGYLFFFLDFRKLHF